MLLRVTHDAGPGGEAVQPGFTILLLLWLSLALFRHLPITIARLQENPRTPLFSTGSIAGGCYKYSRKFAVCQEKMAPYFR